MALDWSQLYLHRKDIAARFGELWRLPLAKRYFNILKPLGSKTTRVLEVGAGARGLKTKLMGAWGEVNYKSCDIDPSHPHEFIGIENVTGEYDLICMFEICLLYTSPSPRDS